MLDSNTKLKIFNSILKQDEISYADSFNGLILMYSENTDFSFLNRLHSKIEIENWIKGLKGRIVIHEDDALVEDIFDDYVLLR